MSQGTGGYNTTVTHSSPISLALCLSVITREPVRVPLTNHLSHKRTGSTPAVRQHGSNDPNDVIQDLIYSLYSAQRLRS